MAFKNLNSPLKNYPLAHLPTLALMIGAFSFWLELYIIRLPSGHSSFLAWGIFIFCLLALLFSRPWQSNIMPSLSDESLVLRVIFALGAFLGAIYLVVGLYASFLPPHLIQETDALMYHITIPRQHLLWHSFGHIPWSVADLFLLPLDYALSPFELATMLPNKLIQFIFFAGSLGCVFHLVYILSGRVLHRAWLGVLAVMACHAVAIQVGLAMLDLVMLYCFLAFIHSLLVGRWTLAAIELAFFFWSKSFIPLQMVVIGLVLGSILFWALKNNFSINEVLVPSPRERKIFMLGFAIASLGIALPHLIKSFYYTGTPLYPFGVGFLSPLAISSPEHWHSILQKAGMSLSVKDTYGHGRSIVAFIKHLWLIAVPEHRVNNAFDYPVGLIYLLVLGPFLSHFIGSLKSKRLPVLSMFVLIWWLTWWFGSQQSRFLLVPICMMIILTISFLPKISKVLIVLIILALGLEVVSLVDANRHDWGKPFSQLLRDQDRKILELQPSVGALDVKLDFPDVAFAPYPVTVIKSDSVFVITP